MRGSKMSSSVLPAKPQWTAGCPCLPLALSCAPPPVRPGSCLLPRPRDCGLLFPSVGSPEVTRAPPWRDAPFPHGRATTTSPDATHPPAICQNSGGGGPWEGVAGGGGMVVRPGGGVPKVGGAAHDPLLPHAYLQGGCVSGGLGVWRYVCDNSAFLSFV